MVQTMEAVSKERELDSDAEKLFEKMVETVEERLSETYPTADDGSIRLNLVPAQDGYSAYLTVDVNDGWIDEKTVENIILGAAGESWVGLERESAGRFLLT